MNRFSKSRKDVWQNNLTGLKSLLQGEFDTEIIKTHPSHEISKSILLGSWKRWMDLFQ
jgi:hypothetical protein